jgi:hypothetical protein
VGQRPGQGLNRGGSWLAAAAILVLGSPALFLAYLPVTDMPQHLAVAAMLTDPTGAERGFAEYYIPAPDPLRRLLSYSVQSAFLRGLGQGIPLEHAMRVFVFLSVVAYPLGVLAVLRALGKPTLLALLALPLAYNRAFFWGFASFDLAVGLGFAGFALLVRERWSGGAALATALVATVAALTHVYGTVFLLGFGVLWLLLAERRALVPRLPALAPAVLGFAAWAWTRLGARGWGTDVVSPDLAERLVEFENAALGGYADWSESAVLLFFAAVFLFLARRALPWSLERWRGLSPAERVLWVYAALNAVLYLVLPRHTETAKFLHFRHAFLALSFLPLLVPADALRRAPRVVAGLLAAIAACTIANSWVHLARFDRESRSFAHVLDAAAPRPRIYSFVYDADGEVMRTAPYLHYAAYIQARKGGLISETFPQAFWNIPVRLREDAGIPQSSGTVPWVPGPGEVGTFFRYYDHVLFRGAREQAETLERVLDRRFELVHLDPPWRLYRVRDVGER